MACCQSITTAKRRSRFERRRPVTSRPLGRGFWLRMSKPSTAADLRRVSKGVVTLFADRLTKPMCSVRRLTKQKTKLLSLF
jgi:hypothetical protein